MTIQHTSYEFYKVNAPANKIFLFSTWRFTRESFTDKLIFLCTEKKYMKTNYTVLGLSGIYLSTLIAVMIYNHFENQNDLHFIT